MAVTRSWTAPGAAPKVVSIEKLRPARGEILWLTAASLFVAGGLAMVYAARTANLAPAEHVVNLNAVQSADELLPILESFPAPERPAIAQKAFEAIERGRPLPNVGALSRVLPLGRLKPLMVVRTPREFRNEFLLWSGVYLAGFYLVAFVWRLRRFPGDRALLPALHLLTGMAMALMLSMRDPLRDTIEFHKMAIGVFAGCLVLAAALPIIAGSPTGATRRSWPRSLSSGCC